MNYGRDCCQHNSGCCVRTAVEVTKQALLRLVADAKEYAMIGLAVETTTLELAADAME